MGLENVFGTPEKIEPEKKLEVITSEEAVIDDWMVYFEQTKKMIWEKWGHLPNYFAESKQFLQSYTKISPKMIQIFNKKVDTSKLNLCEKGCLGVFLSSLMQTSYDKGFNNFEFEEINTDDFGMFLQGQKSKPIRVIGKKISGDDTLHMAKYCFLEAQTIYGHNLLKNAIDCLIKADTINGNSSLDGAKNCSLKTETLFGNAILINSEECVAEIANYEGEYLGGNMNNSTIYTSKLVSWMRLKYQKHLFYHHEHLKIKFGRK
ncbi:DUF3737 family protein, partial [Candidatus Woesearchaeota archaeon]|nr:DUF3737 family protein [Candidatus Woesearchaeota archaeon]